MNFKKIIIITCILFAMSILYWYYFKLESIMRNPASLKNLTSVQIQNAKKNFSPYEERTWNIYADDRYKYFLKFPSGLNIFSIYEQKIKIAKSIGSGLFIRNGGVSFSDPDFDDYGILSVSVFENTDFLNVDEWARNESKKFEHQRLVVEKRIIIDGYDAIVTYVKSDYEREDAYRYEKTAVFIKDGNLFEIWTRFTESSNHEKVWGNFKFNVLES